MGTSSGEIEGISLKVKADATQIKQTFEQALQGLKDRTVQMKLSIVKDSSVERVLREIRQKVTIDVALHPTRTGLRQSRATFAKAISGDGGLPIQVKLKAPTQSQGAAMRRDIVRSIGSPVVDVILNPIWGKGGPSAGGFFGGGGGGGSGVGAGQPVREARAPRPVPQAPRTGPGPRTGVSTRLAGFQRRADEAEDEWTNRLLQSRLVLLQRSNTAAKQESRARAARAVAAIDKQLGGQPMEPARGAAAAAAEVPAPGRNRGGRIVPHVGQSGPTEYEVASRKFFENFARRPLSTPLFVGGNVLEGGTAQAGLDPSMGRGGRFRSPTSGRVISRRAFEESRGTGVHGQRTQRSFLEPGLDLSAADVEQRRLTNVARVTTGRGTTPADDLVTVLKGMPIKFGAAFDEAIGNLQGGKLSAALGRHIGPGETGSGIRGALDSLLMRGRGGKIPGVGPKTVMRVLDPKRGDILPGPHAMAQAEFALEVGVLQDLQSAIMETQVDKTRTAKTKRPTKKHRASVAAARASLPEDPFRAEAEALETEIGSPGGRRVAPTGLHGGVRYASGSAKVVAQGRLDAAQARLREVNQKRADLFRPETKTPAGAAAGPVSAESQNVVPFPHLAAGGGSVGGGAGFAMLGGGHGGPVPVEVINFAELAGMGAVGGSVAAQQTIPSSRDFEKMFQMARDSVEEAAAKLGTAAPGTKGKKAPATAATAQVGLSVRQKIQRGLKAKTLTPEQASQILERGAAMSPQEILAEQGVAPAGAPSVSDALANLQERVAQSRQGLPIRSPAVSIAQSFAGSSRGKITARLSRVTGIETQIRQIESENIKLADGYKADKTSLDAINAKKAAGGKLTKQEVAFQKTLTADMAATGAQIGKNYMAQDALFKQANKLADLTGAEKLANLGRSFAGSIVGTLGYGAALGAVAGAGALAFKALAPLVERSLGYQNVSAAITNNLAEQQKQQGGNVKMLVAQELATKNLTKANADLVAPALEQRATTQAGALAYQGQTEELAAGVNIQNATAGGARGNGRTRFSANPDLYTSSGGFFNTSLFAPQQSTQEAIGRRLDLAGQGMNKPAEPSIVDMLIGGIGGLRTPPPGAGGGPFTPNTTVFKSFQNDVAATGLSLRAVQDRGADLDKTFAALNAADLQEFANAAKSSGIALSGLTGDVQKDAVAVTVLTEALGKAASRRSPDQLLAGQTDAIKGIRFGINQDLQNQLKVFLPAQRALSSLGQPQPAFGRGVIPLNNLADQSPFNLPQTMRGQLNVPGQVSGINVGGRQQFGGVPPEAIASFNRYRSEAQTAIDAVNAKAAEGERVLHDTLGVPMETIAQLRGFGQRIDEISQKQANLQLGLAYSQYNHQLFIAKRTLGDIAGLIGKSGGTEIGVLQRVDMLLGRQNQKLSFKSQLIGQQANELQLQLSQRQINFQRSIAGFTAPGLTPEERAARIEEAKIEADYAQKQLDFQKEQFDLQKQSYELSKAQFENSIALQDALNTRAFTDQAAAIGEMIKAFQTQVEIAALEELKSAISAQRDQLVQDIQAQTSAEESFLKAEAQFATDLLTQTGDWTVATVNKVAQVFQKITAALPPWMRNLGPTGSTGSGGGTPDYSGKPKGGFASGFVGSFNTPTTATFGEAGMEHVAVIRNPRPMPIGVLGGGGAGAGGGLTINMPIYISGNSVRDDKDLTEIATRVSRMVEVNLGRRASQFGLRVTR